MPDKNSRSDARSECQIDCHKRMLDRMPEDMTEKMPSSLSKAVWRPAKLPMFLLVSEALFALLLRQARVMGKEVEKLRKLGFLMDNLNTIIMHHCIFPAESNHFAKAPPSILQVLSCARTAAVRRGMSSLLWADCLRHVEIPRGTKMFSFVKRVRAWVR